jgi:adhesin/invasin
VKVTTSLGVPIANVGVQLSAGSNDVSCAGTNNAGMAFTDASGVATCQVVLGSLAGTLPLTISVPQNMPPPASSLGLVFSGYTLVIKPGAPAQINISSGSNNQIVVSGSALATPLEATVADAAGNPLPGSTVSWKVTSGSMSLINALTTTNPAGVASASGIATGPGGSTVTVTLTAGSATTNFTILVTVPVVTIKAVSGNNQSAPLNQPLSAPLVVQALDQHGNPAGNAPIAFSAGGTAKLGSTSATTVTVTADTNGMASTTVASTGYVAGPVTVTAAPVDFSGKTIPKTTFNVTALPVGPSATGTTVMSSASLTPGIAPGGLVTFMGSGLTPTIQGVVTNSAEMQGYSVTFDGINAPILALVNQQGTGQINAQVPFEESVSAFDSVVISTPNGAISLTNVAVSEFAPAIFTNGTLGPNQPLAVALRPDGSYVTASNPAQRGENITFFATGLGQTAPLASTGVAGVAGQSVAGIIYAGVNNQSDQLIAAIYEPNALGVYATTIQIPPSTQSGPAQPLGLLMADSQGNSFVAPLAYIPIQ